LVGKAITPSTFGVLVEDRVVAEVIGHPPHRRGRAVDRRQQRHEIARTHPAIGPPVAQERLAFGFRHELDRFDAFAEGVVQIKLALVHLDVLGVDVLAGGDVLRGKPDDLAVPSHRLPLRDRVDRQLVTRRDHLRHRDVSIRRGEDGPWQQRLLGDHHVIGWVELHRDIGNRHRAPLGPAEEWSGGCRHRWFL